MEKNNFYGIFVSPNFCLKAAIARYCQRKKAKAPKLFFYTNLAYEDAPNGKSGIKAAKWSNRLFYAPPNLDALWRHRLARSFD